MLHSNLQILETKTKNVLENGWWIRAQVFTCLQYKSFENTEGKGEIARNEQFLLFQQCFLLVWITFFNFHQIWNWRLQTLSVWKSQKTVVWERVQQLNYGKPITRRQILDFQTKTVCRRKFQIWRKWQKAIQTGRKHCVKRRSCSLWAISPFPTVFSKGLFHKGVKRCHCVGMG